MSWNKVAVVGAGLIKFGELFTQSYEQRNPVAAIPVRTTGSSAVGRTGEHLDVLWAGRDGSVWSNWWDQNANNGAWKGGGMVWLTTNVCTVPRRARETS